MLEAQPTSINAGPRTGKRLTAITARQPRIFAMLGANMGKMPSALRLLKSYQTKQNCLNDTSNGVNYSDADRGLKLHLADSRPFSGGDLAAAEAGVKIHQTASVPGQQTEWRSWSATQSGLKVHLSEHSLDRGGVGDTSRAMEILNESNSNR